MFIANLIDLVFNADYARRIPEIKNLRKNITLEEILSIQKIQEIKIITKVGEKNGKSN